MHADAILKLKVMDITSGTIIGSVTGVLIDGSKRQVVALQVGGGLLAHLHYLPFAQIKAIENDVLTISSAEILVERGAYKIDGLVGNLNDRQVFTEDGKNLGTIHEFDVDTANGEITAITVAIDTAVFGIFWRSAGERFDIPRDLITILGDNVVVTNAALQTIPNREHQDAQTAAR